jgi:hypothetical protein
MKGVGVTALFGPEIGNAYLINKFTGQGGLSEVFREDIPRSMLFGGRPSQWAAFDGFFGEGPYGSPRLPLAAMYCGAMPWGCGCWC